MQQADCAHSAIGIIPSPGKIEPLSATRRGILGALASLPAIAITATSAEAFAHVRPRWYSLRDRFETTAKAAADYDEFVYAPELKRINSLIGEQPPLWFEQAFPNGQSYRFGVDPKKLSPFADPVLNERHDRAVSARNDWKGRHDRIRRADRWLIVSRQSDDLYVAADRARAALMSEPAPDAAALALKVQLMLANDEIWDADRLALLADAERLSA